GRQDRTIHRRTKTIVARRAGIGDEVVTELLIWNYKNGLRRPIGSPIRIAFVKLWYGNRVAKYRIEQTRSWPVDVVHRNVVSMLYGEPWRDSGPGGSSGCLLRFGRRIHGR